MGTVSLSTVSPDTSATEEDAVTDPDFCRLEDKLPPPPARKFFSLEERLPFLDDDEMDAVGVLGSFGSSETGDE